MKRMRSLKSIFFRYLVVSISITVLVAGLIMTGSTLHRAASDMRQLEKDFIAQQQEILRREIEGVFRYIRYRKERSRTRSVNQMIRRISGLKKLIRPETDMTASERTRHILKESTAGNYFTAGLLPLEPGLKTHGSNIPLTSQEQDRIRQNLRQEPYTLVELTADRDQGLPVRSAYASKISRDWMIVAILDHGARIKALKQAVLSYIASIRFGIEGYVFVNTFEGLPLVRDGRLVHGEPTMWDLQDPNGVYVIREENRVASLPEGGFIHYTWRRLHTEQLAPKMSFVRGDRDWNWMIGAGVYLDNIEQLLANRKMQINQMLRDQLIRLILAFAVLLGLSIFLGRRLSNRFDREFRVFSDFFRETAHEHKPIDESELSISDFQQLSRDANTMLQERLQIENELLSSEQKFRQLFEKSTDAMSIYDSGRFIDCNQAVLDLLRIENRAQFMVHPVDFSPEYQPDGSRSADTAKKFIDNAMETGSNKFEWLHRRLGGELFWCEIVLTRIPWEGRECLFCVWRDISHRKSIEHNLRESESKLVKSQEMAHVGNWELDPETGQYTGSDEIYRIFGLAPSGEAVPAAFILEAIVNEDRERIEERLRNLIIHGKPFDCMFRIRRHDNGEIRFTHSRAEAHRNEKGRCTRIIGVIQDVTELKDLEGRVMTERERLAITLRSIAEAVIATDADGHITLLNPVAQKLTGSDERHAKGKHLSEILRIESESLDNPAALPEEGILLDRKGNPVEVMISSSPVSSGNGKPLGYVLVIRDITERRRMESSLQQTQRLESLGLLAGGIAHDFNNQLTGISGHLSLLQDMLENDHPGLRLLQDADRATEVCQGLTNQLLTFSTGGKPLMEQVDISHLIEETVTFSCRGTAVQTTFDIEADLRPAFADPGQLRQALSNLSLNAVQAMNGQGQLTVRARNIIVDSKPAIRIEISDQGTGIPTEIREQIFDPFFTTKPNGSGLGLTITHSIVRRHGGSMELVSSGRKGTSFRIQLPAMTKVTSTPQAIEEAPVTGTYAVLVMDDEPMIREIAGELLEHLGHEVETVPSGEDALTAYTRRMNENKPFDLVILDVTVPGGMGGKETLLALQKVDPDVAAVVSSGYSHDPLLAEFSEHGFRARLEKPFRLADVKRVLAETARTFPADVDATDV